MINRFIAYILILFVFTFSHARAEDYAVVFKSQQYPEITQCTGWMSEEEVDNFLNNHTTDLIHYEIVGEEND